MANPEEAQKIVEALKRKDILPWQQKRLIAMRMAAEGKWQMQQIADAVRVSRATIGTWLQTMRKAGVEGLLKKEDGQGAPGRLDSELQEKLKKGLEEGKWRRARDIQRWIEKEKGIAMGLGGIYYWLGKLGGV